MASHLEYKKKEIVTVTNEPCGVVLELTLEEAVAVQSVLSRVLVHNASIGMHTYTVYHKLNNIGVPVIPDVLFNECSSYLTPKGGTHLSVEKYAKKFIESKMTKDYE